MNISSFHGIVRPGSITWFLKQAILLYSWLFALFNFVASKGGYRKALTRVGEKLNVIHMQTTEETGRKISKLVNDLKTGTIVSDVFFSDPMHFIGQYEIAIPAQNVQALQAELQANAKENEQGAKHHACWACKIGLTIAFAALVVLIVSAVVAAIVTYAPEIAASAATAFLANQTAFAVVAGVIIAGCGALAWYVCHHLIKC